MFSFKRIFQVCFYSVITGIIDRVSQACCREPFSERIPRSLLRG
jgi:hypothetical protein